MAPRTLPILVLEDIEKRFGGIRAVLRAWSVPLTTAE